MRFWITNTGLTVKVISWIQIIGGIIGLGLIAKVLLNTETINGVMLLIFLTGLSLFIFSIYARTQLLSRDNKKLGITLSILNQVLQLIQWNILGYGLSYSSGAEVLIGFYGVSLNFSASLLSSFDMSINSDGDSFIRLNIIPIIVIIILSAIIKKDNSSQKEI